MNRELIQRRLQFYDRVAPTLNDLFCFFCLRGAYRGIAPPAAVDDKRKLDAEFHINLFLFSESVRVRYEDFIDACFRTFVGAGQDAQLRADVEVHRSERTTWDPDWDHRYVSDRAHISERSAVEKAYNALMESLARDIGVTTPEAAESAGGSPTR